MSVTSRSDGAYDFSPVPVSHSSMRAANTGLVLRSLFERGSRSRASLVSDVGLSKASISNIVAELAERGVVREGAAERAGRVGRPGTEVMVNAQRVCAIGIAINVEYVTACFMDLSGEVQHRMSRPMPSPATPEAVVSVLVEVVDSLVSMPRAKDAWLAGVCIASPGVVQGGVVHLASNLQWVDVPLVDMVREALARRSVQGERPNLSDLAVWAENDAKLSAIAAVAEFEEFDVADLLFVTGDHGVGAGIVSGGRLIRGSEGLSGEVGHIRLHPDGRECPCGRRGCLEAYVGAQVLFGAVPEDSPAHDTQLPMLDRLVAIRKLYEDGHPSVCEAFDGIGRELRWGISTLVDVLNPAVVVLGGYFGVFEEIFAERVAGELASSALGHAEPPRVVATKLGLDAAAVGAALEVIESVLVDPSRVPLLAEA